MTTENDSLTESLFQRGTLMHLHVRRWTGVKKTQKSDLLMEQVDENALYLGHKKLLPKKSMERIVNIEGRARTQFAALSIDFPLPGIRFVSFHALETVLSRLRPLKEELAQAVEQLLVEYPTFMEEQLRLLDGEAQKIATEELKKIDPMNRADKEKELQVWLEAQRRQTLKAYPTADDLRTRFGMDWRMFTISALTGVEELTNLQAEDIEAAKKQLQDELSGWVKMAAVEMHKSLGEAAANARQLLEKNGKLDPRNLRPLFAAMETFSAVDFTGASDFKTVVEDIKKRFFVTTSSGEVNYNATAENVNTDYARQELSSLLNRVGELAVDETAESAGIQAVGRVGEFARVVELD